MIAVASCSPGGNDQDDIAAIEAVMRATWDRPEAPLDAGPIAVSGDYAVADWTQGDMGGRALFRRDGSWKVVLCSGDGLRTTEGLQSVGVPARDARNLEVALTRLERDVSGERLAAMSLFAGVVRME
ncbi:MAG: copper uptake system-associated protein [Hyphomonadaceae bacterium]|nr:copper uptake system-associated protein [Hyphomonadaceae bacterium]